MQVASAFQCSSCFIDMNVFFSLQELDLPYIKIAATEIVSGVSGNSEEKIRGLFDKAVVSCFFNLVTYLTLILPIIFNPENV